jgi:hypothetical protein
MCNSTNYIFTVRIETDRVLNLLNESSIPFVESDFDQMVFEPNRSATVEEFTSDLRVQAAIVEGLICIETH